MSAETTTQPRRLLEANSSPESVRQMLESSPPPEVSIGFVNDVVNATGSDFLKTQWASHLNAELPQLEARIATNQFRAGTHQATEIARQVLDGHEFGWWNLDAYRARLDALRDVTSEGQFVNVFGQYALQRVANHGPLMIPNHTDLFPEPNAAFIDALSNATVTNFGNFPPYLVIASSLNRLTGGALCPPYHPGVLMQEAAQRLISMTPIESSGARVAWFNAGGDAVSVAMGAAEKYVTQVHGENGVRKAVYCRLAYHGNMEGRAGRATTGIREAFHQKDQHSIELEFPDTPQRGGEFISTLERLVNSKEVSCVIFEPTQGDGGGVTMDSLTFVEMAKLSLDKKIPLICDEVQSGFGRSGRVFDVEYLLDEWKASSYVQRQGYPEKPPIIFAVAKSITNGIVPGSAAILPKEYAVLGRAEGLNTYSAHPTALAAAIVTSEIMGPETLAMVHHKRAVFDAAIAPYLGEGSCIEQIRGHGLHLFAVISGQRGNEVLQVEMANRRVLIGTTGRETIRLHAPINAPDIVWKSIGVAVGQTAREVAAGHVSPETLKILNSGTSGLASR